MNESQFELTCIEQLVTLICRYGFDLEDWSPQSLISNWLEEYPYQWIYLAVLEALYQGRYKIISVEQILKFWLRRGSPKVHFSDEFESMINRTTLEPSLSSIHPTPNIEKEEKTPERPKKHSIGEFIPLIDASDFYNRLKSVAEQNING